MKSVETGPNGLVRYKYSKMKAPRAQGDGATKYHIPTCAHVSKSFILYLASLVQYKVDPYTHWERKQSLAPVRAELIKPIKRDLKL